MVSVPVTDVFRASTMSCQGHSSPYATKSGHVRLYFYATFFVSHIVLKTFFSFVDHGPRIRRIRPERRFCRLLRGLGRAVGGKLGATQDAEGREERNLEPDEVNYDTT